MINRTRITVDEATRDVLDQLSTELSRKPSWALQFGEDLKQDIADAFRDAHVGLTRSLDGMTASTQALKTQYGKQVESLSAMDKRLHLLVGLTEAVKDDSVGQAKRLSDLQDALDCIGKRSHDGQASQARTLERIITATDALQPLVKQHGESLSAVGSQLQTLVGRTDTLQEDSSNQANRLASMQASLEAMQECVNQQVPTIDCLVQGVARLAELPAHCSSAAAEHRQEIDLLRNDCQTVAEKQAAGQMELTATLQQLVTTLRSIHDEQTTQRDVLAKLASGLENLSQPWWRRVFAFHRTNL